MVARVASGSCRPLLRSGTARHPGTGRWPRSGQERARPAPRRAWASFGPAGLCPRTASPVLLSPFACVRT